MTVAALRRKIILPALGAALALTGCGGESDTRTAEGIAAAQAAADRAERAAVRAEKAAEAAAKQGSPSEFTEEEEVVIEEDVEPSPDETAE